MSNIKTFNDYNEKPVGIEPSYSINNNNNNNSNSYNNNYNNNNNIYVSQTNEEGNLFKYDKTCLTWKCFTFFIIIINILMFIFEMIYYAAHKKNGKICTFYNFQALYAPAVAHGHIQRLFMPIFLHGSWHHLFSNTIALLYGFCLEKLIGHILFIILYISSGFNGFLFSGVVEKNSIGLGASGCCFGIEGCILIFYIFNYKKINTFAKITMAILCLYLIYNILASFNVFGDNDFTSSDGNKISWAGHLGGLLYGIFLSIILLSNKYDQDTLSAKCYYKLRLFSIIFCILFPVLFFILIFALNHKKSSSIGC